VKPLARRNRPGSARDRSSGGRGSSSTGGGAKKVSVGTPSFMDSSGAGGHRQRKSLRARQKEVVEGKWALAAAALEKREDMGLVLP